MEQNPRQPNTSRTSRQSTPRSTYTPHFPIPCSDAKVYSAERADKCAGVFYGGDGSSLAVGVVFMLALTGWILGTCLTLFFTIKATIGIRVSEEIEVSRGSSFIKIVKSALGVSVAPKTRGKIQLIFTEGLQI